MVTVLELEINYLILNMFYFYHKLSLKSNHHSVKVKSLVSVPCGNRVGKEKCASTCVILSWAHSHHILLLERAVVHHSYFTGISHYSSYSLA